MSVYIAQYYGVSGTASFTVAHVYLKWKKIDFLVYNRTMDLKWRRHQVIDPSKANTRSHEHEFRADFDTAAESLRLKFRCIHFIKLSFEAFSAGISIQ